MRGQRERATIIVIYTFLASIFLSHALNISADDEITPPVFELTPSAPVAKTRAEAEHNTTDIKITSDIPGIPEPDQNREIQVLLDLSQSRETTTDPKQIDLELDAPKRKQEQYIVKKVDEDKPRWTIKDEHNKTIAQVAVRKNQLLFTWDVKNATELHKTILTNSKLTLKGRDNHHIRFRELIKTPDHGYNLSHTTPENVAHLCTIPNCPDDATLFLEVKDFDPETPLGKLPRKKRVKPLKRWVEFELDINKYLTILMQWRAKRPGNVKEQDFTNEMEITQKVSYELPGGKKNLPLSPIQINKHRQQLIQQAKEQENILKNGEKRLKELEKKLRRAKAAPRGTSEWSKRTHYHNQIKTLVQRMKSAKKRYKAARRDFEILKPMEQLLQNLNGRPIPYRIFTQLVDSQASVVESESYQISAEVCFPLVGSWINEKGHSMKASRDSITWVIDGKTSTGEIKSSDYIGPCSKDPKSVALYEKVRSTTLVLFFGNNRVQMRRVFVIRDATPDIAGETTYARSRDPFGGDDEPFLDWVLLSNEIWKRVK